MLIPPRFLWAPLFNCEKFVTEARQSCVGSPRAPVLLWVSASETRRKSSEVSPVFINTIWCKLSSKLFKITSRLCCLPRSARMPSPQTGCSSDVRAPGTQLRPICGAFPAPLSSSCQPGRGGSAVGRVGARAAPPAHRSPEHPSVPRSKSPGCPTVTWLTCQNCMQGEKQHLQVPFVLLRRFAYLRCPLKTKG